MANRLRKRVGEWTVFRMKNGKYQVGLIGAGGIALGEHLPGWRALTDVEVVAVADPSEAAITRASEKYAIPQTFSDALDLLAIDDLDIVDICTPNRAHAPIALAALERRLHVLCEKPLATTSAEVLQLQEASRRMGKMLMTAHHFRFRPICQQLKALVLENIVGDIYYTRAQWLRRRMVPARPTFISSSVSGGGSCMDIGVHVLDLAMWLMGSPQPVGVSAIADAYLAHRPDITGTWGDWDRHAFDVEDFAAGFVKFADGSALVLESSWLAFQPENETTRIQCYGRRGGLLFPDGIVTGESGRVPWTMKLEAPTPEPNAWAAEIAAFMNALRDGRPSPVPVEETLNVIRVLEAFYASAKSGREIVLG